MDRCQFIPAAHKQQQQQKKNGVCGKQQQECLLWVSSILAYLFRTVTERTIIFFNDLARTLRVAYIYIHKNIFVQNDMVSSVNTGTYRKYAVYPGSGARQNKLWAKYEFMNLNWIHEIQVESERMQKIQQQKKPQNWNEVFSVSTRNHRGSIAANCIWNGVLCSRSIMETDFSPRHRSKFVQRLFCSFTFLSFYHQIVRDLAAVSVYLQPNAQQTDDDRTVDAKL